jgi:hypothetical protein
VLVVGSRDEIATRLAQLRGADLTAGVEMDPERANPEDSSFSFDFELHVGEEADGQSTLHTLLPPELPEDLTLSQAAQVSELLQYFHLRLRGLVQSVQPVAKSDRVTLEQRQWQNLLDLYERLSVYTRSMGEPDK